MAGTCLGDGRVSFAPISSARLFVGLVDAERRPGEAMGQRMRVTFEIVGPLTRSTLECDHPDPQWERLSDAQYWCECTRRQAGRFERSVHAELRRRPGLLAFARRSFAATSFDEHCLLVTGRNLERALCRLKRKDLDQAPQIGGSQALKFLRNVYEHWDALRSAYRQGRTTGAAQKLIGEFPEAEPWTFQLYPDGDIVLAKVVSLRKLIKDVRSLEARVWWKLRDLQRQGRHQASNQAPNPAVADSK